MSNKDKEIPIEIDHFISKNTKIPDSKVFKEDKLLDFAGIKVGTIDPRITEEVLLLTKSIKDKISQINSLK